MQRQQQHHRSTYVVFSLLANQMKSAGSLGEVSIYLSTLAHHLLISDAHSTAPTAAASLLLRQLVHQTLDACHACLRHHCDVTPLIDVVHDIAAKHPEVCTLYLTYTYVYIVCDNAAM